MQMLSTLNEVQRSAALHEDGPLLILAGAGSGKTRVLTHRISYLIQEKKVPSWAILAITFTNKAAKEMKERVIKLVGHEAEDMWISTFHSSCVRMLRRDIERIGYSKNFVIYDSADQGTLVKECLKELNLNEKNFPVKTVQSAIGDAKDKLITHTEFAKMMGADVRMDKIANIYSLYQKKLKENNALDFDDLIMKTVELFVTCPDILEYYQKRFKYILVDEYQDTNGAQYRLVNLLAKAHRNLCVVGDDDQSIYGWRGADIRNILDFEKDYPDTKIVKLEQNYRSTQNILDAANGIIKRNFGRKNKSLWTDKGLGDEIEVYCAQNENDEAKFVVSKIKSSTSIINPNYGDFAVLYRMNAQSRAIEDALMASSIPYRIFGGLRFYDRKEIKDTLSYLRAIYNPSDSVSLRRIINVPKRSIGNTTIDALEQMAADAEVGLYEIIETLEERPGLSARAKTSIIGFRELMEDLRNKSHKMSITEFIQYVLETTNYIDELKKEEGIESQTRIENLGELLTVASEYEAQGKTTLADFLEGVALVSDIDSKDENENAVVLMTLHTAKGLEFPNVFLVGLEEGTFPLSRAAEDPEQLEEERRLCYVGITRAMDRLYISWAKTRTIFGRSNYCIISRFLKELPQHVLGNNSASTPVTQKINAEIASTRGLSNSGYSSNFFRGMSPSPQPKPSIQNGSSDFNMGDKVEHSKWGKGTIISLKGKGENAEVKVAFDGSGIKDLAVAFAKLTKLN